MAPSIDPSPPTTTTTRTRTRMLSSIPGYTPRDGPTTTPARPARAAPQAMGLGTESPPNQIDKHQGESKGEEDLHQVAFTVDPAKEDDFDQGAEHTERDRRRDQGQPEIPSDAEHRQADVGTQHIEGTVREIEHVHQSEDHREACCQQEDQPAEGEPIENRREGDFDRLSLHGVVTDQGRRRWRWWFSPYSHSQGWDL